MQQSPEFTIEDDNNSQEDSEEFSGDQGPYHRPEELQKLESQTKFTRKEIQLMYRGFKQECPTGMVDEDSFLEIFSQFFPLGDSTNYGHYVFATLKRREKYGKKRNVICFENFLTMLSQVSRGTIEEKLQWVFDLYDLDSDGKISKSEMVEIVTSIYEMLGRATQPAVDDTSAKEHVEKVFNMMDANQDGFVTYQDLLRWCKRDENLVRSLGTLDTVL